MISIEGSSLWEDVHIIHKMPLSFLGLSLDRAGGRRLTIHFKSCDYLRSGARREAYLRAIQPIADRIRSFTVHVTSPNLQWERSHLLDLFTITYLNLESLDLSYNAFYVLSRWHDPDQPSYRPGINGATESVILQIINFMPSGRLKHLTLRHTKGWPPTRFGNLTDITLFGYADGTALAEAVPANPALQKLKLESIKHKERYSYDPKHLINLDGQTLELARCEPDVLSMFALSSTCSLIITRTMDQRTIARKGEAPEFQWLPSDISGIRCLHELGEVHFSVTKIPGRWGWTAAEQKTVGYSTSNSTLGSGPRPSVTFTLTYHSGARTQGCEIPFEPKYLLPHPTPWEEVTRASFDGFHNRFKIRCNTILKTLPNLHSLTLRRCDSGRLVRFITPDELGGLESLRFEDELSGADFGYTLSEMFELRHVSAGLRLKELRIRTITSGDPSSIFTVEQMGKLKECVRRIEVTKAPSYKHAVMSEYN